MFNPGQKIEKMTEDVIKLRNEIDHVYVDVSILRASINLYRSILIYQRRSSDGVRKFNNIHPNFSSENIHSTYRADEDLLRQLKKLKRQVDNFGHMVEEDIGIPIYSLPNHLPAKFDGLFDQMVLLENETLHLIERVMAHLTWEQTAPYILIARSIMTDLIIDDED